MTRLVVNEQDVSTLPERYFGVRDLTEVLAAPLSPEDQTVQSMPDVSPTKWHRAHTTWFFETFLLEPSLPGYRVFNLNYAYLFNSYYESVGSRHPRPSRGLLSRPRAHEVAYYRNSVDSAMQQLIAGRITPEIFELIELGLNHEQQHQELLLMDIKHVLSQNLPQPAYTLTGPAEAAQRLADGIRPRPAARIEHDGGLCEVGHTGDSFFFDNELPRHVEFLKPFALDARPVTCSQWIEFIEDGGYERPELWLSDGWAAVQSQGWEAPLYWSKDLLEPRESDDWSYFTLGGPRIVDGAEPVCHISYYEADAFARWAGARLPTEAEWEAIASRSLVTGNFLDPTVLHPLPIEESSSMFGDVWQWTSSSYSPYPGFKPASGAVGEYNGKFMVSQYVLRGGCCATPPGHLRATYRNFFPPGARWAFSGLRLAHDC
jgi:ergothioneine biosynthesis protein EgtB